MIALVLAGVAVAVLLALVLPVLRGGQAFAGRARYDAAVYRDQLKELERDRVRGVIGEAEENAARVEIERRLLAVAAMPAEGPAKGRRSVVLAVGVAMVVAVGAGGLYLRLGAPAVPGAPFAVRVAARGSGVDVPNHPDMAKIATALGEKLRADPNNPEGWQLYARTLGIIGNWQASAGAWRNRIALGGAAPDDYASYGEMLVLGSEGVVTPAAREAFGNAMKSDASNAVARFYLALADAQAGRGQQAIDAWVKLAGEVSDADMRSEIARRLQETAKLFGLAAPVIAAAPPAPVQGAAPAPLADQAAGPMPGPDQEQIAAAAGMPDADRAAMIKSMVAQLAARLQANPNDADGWMQLGRAYAVLAEHDKSADAYEHAAALKPNDVSPLMQGVQEMIEQQKPDAPLPRRAVDLLHRAERIDQRQPEVLWYLGVVEAQAGHIGAAQDYWRRVLDLLPADSPDRKTVTDAIEAVKKE